MLKVLIILICALLLISFVSAIKITEIEMNPPETDTGNEWIELYNKEEINLEGYKLGNNDEDEIILNGSFLGYYVYIFDKQWLDNSDEKIFLYKNDELIDETDLFVDNGNDIKTWQLCDSWKFLESTKGEQNNCGETEKDETEILEEPIKEETIEESPEEETPEQNIAEEILLIEKSAPAPEVIKLTPKNIKSENDNSILDNSNYAKYGFIVFCILLGLLFILKRRNKPKNEFEQKGQGNQGN